MGRFFVIDIYTLICIKWITNKNLVYKKINKFKNSKKNGKVLYFLDKETITV